MEFLKEQSSILYLAIFIVRYFLLFHMEPKYRCFPPAVPLKMNKLIEYEYLDKIYGKQILPYFSEIAVTNKLQPLKFIYFPIENPHKLKNLRIGLPFKPDNDLENQTIHQIAHQATFIKIALQTHLIFDYLMNLNLACIPLQRLKFQDKLWFFSEGLVRNFSFGDIVFRKDSRREKGIFFFLEGEFVCLNELKKPFKTISKGYLIDMNGNFKKVKYDDKMKTDRISFDESILGSANRELQTDVAIQKQLEEKVSMIWSHSNSAKVLFISYAVIKKYCQNFQDQDCKSSDKKQQKTKVNQQLKPMYRTQSQLMYKNQKIKTETEQLEAFANGRRTFDHRKDSSVSKKKFNIISYRGGPLLSPANHIEELFEHQIIKSYTKEKQIYQIMLKRLSISRHRKLDLIGNQKMQLIDGKKQMMPFFKQTLKNQKDKMTLRRRKTKELWGNSSMHKQNFILNSKNLAQQFGNEQALQKNLLKSSKLMKKLSKDELSAFQLLKRNLLNKQYHRSDFFQIHS